jgi:hypothetical protein
MELVKSDFSNFNPNAIDIIPIHILADMFITSILYKLYVPLTRIKVDAIATFFHDRFGISLCPSLSIANFSVVLYRNSIILFLYNKKKNCTKRQKKFFEILSKRSGF